MTSKPGEIQRYIETMTKQVSGNLRQMSVQELDAQIAAAESYIARLQYANPENPSIVTLGDILWMLRLARGKGEVL